ncbi:hypothetical protein PR048_016955 [Dryococelus australis]|uniref:Transposase n=1 Tax=Dryococelus australis TaxID=614101 RepID=A0ABQ9H859_9NEOP|nr:hypothetical protein PR048_016955 [Dryococelus australis]
MSGVSEQTVDHVRDVMQRSPGKSTYQVSAELTISRPTVWKILCKQLVMSYKLQLLQTISHHDKLLQLQFCIDML